jgi:AraC-like DNA-binding protein
LVRDADVRNTGEITPPCRATSNGWTDLSTAASPLRRLRPLQESRNNVARVAIESNLICPTGMRNASNHLSRVLGSPWSGVYSTHIASGRHLPRHWHETYGFGLLERGAHCSASDRRTVRAYAGDVITTNPGEIHDGRPLGAPMRIWRTMYVDAAVMAAMTGQAVNAEIARPVIDDPKLVTILRRLFRRIDQWNAKSAVNAVTRLACEESIVEACVLLMARHGTMPLSIRVPDDDIRRVRDCLADTALDPPTLTEMAAMTGLSKYQVLRRFERAYGLPPHAWLLRVRAERARVLIRDGVSLTDAASAAGFSDQSHMTRMFMRLYGFTPGAWRKATSQ